MSRMPMRCNRRYGRFSPSHISPVMHCRICRAFSRPIAKQLHTDSGCIRSNVMSSASVYESNRSPSSDSSTPMSPHGGVRSMLPYMRLHPKCTSRNGRSTIASICSASIRQRCSARAR